MKMKYKDVDEFYYLSDNLNLDMPNYFEDLKKEFIPELTELSYFGKNNYIFNEIKNIFGDISNGKYYELKLEDSARDEKYMIRIAINELAYVIEVLNEGNYKDNYMCLYKFT